MHACAHHAGRCRLAALRTLELPALASSCDAKRLQGPALAMPSVAGPSTCDCPEAFLLPETCSLPLTLPTHCLQLLLCFQLPPVAMAASACCTAAALASMNARVCASDFLQVRGCCLVYSISIAIFSEFNEFVGVCAPATSCRCEDAVVGVLCCFFA